MDKRTALPQASALSFPGLTCYIVSEIGRGSNALVYRAWYPDHFHDEERHEVLIKELFPLHPGGEIYRGADGEIIRTPRGEATYEIHRRSFEAGNAVHLALLRKQPDEMGTNLNTYALNGTLYTVLGFNGGRSLREELTGPAIALRPLVERTVKLLDALEGFHGNGLLHLDIAPDNIMLLGKGNRERVMLIDYNSCQEIGGVEGEGGIFSIKSGYTAPEIRGGRYRDVGPGSDLYSVAAVFYHGIVGEPLTPFQMTRPQPPDVSQCPCMADVPDTVLSWTRAILKRGLSVLPSRRYRSVHEMRDDLLELLDRIDGVGVTHSALWEAGRRGVARAVRDNPSRAYLRDTDKLFSSNARMGNETAPVGEQFNRLAAAGENALLVAGGGMGKTTAMLRTALAQTGRYSPVRPAVAYLSLYGWQPGESNYILDRILETLRFKPETHSFEDARKALTGLLEQPLSDSHGTRPVLLLLLDGLNETPPERQPLIDEILRLSRMRGVGVVVATRADESALPFARLELAELEDTEVCAALADAGLLEPQSPEMRRLLRTPLMLSIFIQASLAEHRQLGVQTQDELMQAYFAALKEKEIAAMPDNGQSRWQIEAALEYVLPTLARELARHEQALEDAKLLPAVESCWRLFGSRLMRRAFPQWIGHSAAIRGEAKNAEEWYGSIVHELLWKRLGLLIRDERGRYQVSHQIIGEYLLDIDRKNRGKIARRQRLKGLLVGAALTVVLCGGALGVREVLRPKPYDMSDAQTVFEYAEGAYVDAMEQCLALRDALDSARSDPEHYAVVTALPNVSDNSLAQDKLKRIVQQGQVMPWSRVPISLEYCEELLALPSERREEYRELLGTLNFLMTDDGAFARYAVERGFQDKLSELLGIDGEIAATLYDIVCAPHLTGIYQRAPATADYGAESAEGEPVADPAEALARLRVERDQARQALNETGAIYAWRDR